MTEYGLVLSGGGAMGSYEIGVWKALRELKIDIKGVAGTSVGALNGAMILQDDFEKALELWERITIDQVIDVDTSLLRRRLLKWTREDFSLFFSLFKEFIREGGFDTTPLRLLLEDTIDEELIRRSPMDFGINTYSVSDLKLVELYLEEIPRGELISYLMASACLVIFKRAEINNKKFIDGGYFDNVPVNLLIKKGYRNLIVVELMNIFKRPPIEEENLNIIKIKSSKSIGGIMEFNPKRAKKNIVMGYEDTIKVFA